MKLTTKTRVPLKDNSEVNEAMIQEFVFNNPSVLGLGDLEGLKREKTQPLGGRFDVLLCDADNSARYEVEIQLGATDPSHIIRTIEYWDTERKRYPQFDHCAVIIAEQITSRFLNVISLFNGTIPLIAIQLAAFKSGDDVQLVFTKVLDRISPGTDEEDQNEVTDRAYWEKKSSKKYLEYIDVIHKEISSYAGNYDLKYNKFYIGLSNSGKATNFIYFCPKKSFLYLYAKCEENQGINDSLDKCGIEYSYDSRWKRYRVRLNNSNDYVIHKDVLNEKLVRTAMEHFKIDIDD